MIGRTSASEEAISHEPHGSYAVVRSLFSGESVGADGEYERAHVHQRCRADLAEKLPKLPSPGRSCPLFDAHLRRGAALGRSDEASRAAEINAALVCRSASWTFLQ